ncbi:MAG: 23S rRNA (guanosine(2251)-2'-O)-methyltransferase RlmB [Ruminococcaceae bacterium]|nr:23S rRNA (guanosine(2251)-2'-O)-methyltransferase RlmB [Oscillospiraceae bacterium]
MDYEVNTDKIEGRNPVMEALRSGREIDKLLVAKGEKNGSIVKIVARAKAEGIVVSEVERAKLDAMSETKAHQGVIALTAVKAYASVADLLERAKRKGEPPFLVICDEVTDPHNLGAIIRTANAAGAHGVIIPKRRSAGLNAVVAKTSAGAVEFTPVARVSNIAQTIEKLKKENVWVIGADMDGANDIYAQDFSGAVAIVIGSEGNGISPLVKQQCDFLTRIPMLGEITSLNASVAGALMIYEVVRARKAVK